MKRLLPAKCKKGHILGDEKIQGVLTGVSRYIGLPSSPLLTLHNMKRRKTFEERKHD